MKYRKLAAHYALLPDGVLKNPMVAVDDEGRIVSVGSCDPAQTDSCEGVEFHAGMLAPAFVNAHSHLELAYLKGAIPQGCGYGGFAGAMAAVRNRFSLEERLRAIEIADREMYEAGIGAVGDISNDESSFAAKAQSKIHYRTFCEVFGLKTDNLLRARGMAAAGDTFSLTPHSLYSLNDNVLKEVCRESCGVLSIHFMESPAESGLFHGEGSLHEWFATQGFNCDFLGYGSPAERLVACVPADRSVMLVHCTCVTQRDIDLIMNHFSAPVYWCLSPASNRYISGMQPDAELLRRNGLTLCIGTDSLASNSSLSMVEELKLLANVPADEVLRWATANGAEALGFNDGTGRLEVGSRCGIVAVSGIDFATMRFTEKLAVRRLI